MIFELSDLPFTTQNDHILVDLWTYDGCNVTLKEDNTNCRFYLYWLLHVISNFIKSGAVCTSVHLYTIIICTDGKAVYVFLHAVGYICVLTEEYIYM